jgi:uncharacterized protein
MDQETTVLDRGAVISREEAVSRLRRNEDAIRKFGVTGLYLFGSTARDEMNSDSDVDIFIDYVGDGSFTFVEWFNLQELPTTILGRRVDFTSRQGLHKRLRTEIERTALRVL